MDDPGAHAPAAAAGALLVATATQLRIRRDDLEPLVSEYDRLQEVCDAIGDLPDVDQGLPEDGSPRRQHADLVGHLGRMRAELREWSNRLEPLVKEYEQILHVLTAFESAESGPARARAGRRRARGARPAGVGASPSRRLEELRGLLTQPRTRAELAERMALSPSRVTGLLDELARTGEVVEQRDPDRPSRKLWALADRPEGGEVEDGRGGEHVPEQAQHGDAAVGS